MAGKRKSYYNKYYTDYADSTKKKYLSQKLKKQIEATGDFGNIGSKKYLDAVKIYFGLGKLDKNALAGVKDEQQRFRILGKYSAREQYILSGEYLKDRMAESKDNLIEILGRYTGFDTDFSKIKDIGNANLSSDSLFFQGIVDKINNLGDKQFNVLSALWKVVNEYYTSVKENIAGMDEESVEKEMDDTLTRVMQVFREYNI